MLSAAHDIIERFSGKVSYKALLKLFLDKINRNTNFYAATGFT